jgi:hypothetical protein
LFQENLSGKGNSTDTTVAFSLSWVRFGHGLMWAGLPVIHEFMGNAALSCSFIAA